MNDIMLRKENGQILASSREVAEKFGKENLIHLLHQMKEMETVMTSEIEQMEEDGELED